ncbi:MAG: response regulator [Pseudomonadota bacterium]
MTDPMPSVTVHIVDDEADIRDALALLLKAERYSTREYDSADDFLARYDGGDSAHAVVLMDVRMPGTNGLAAHEQLRARHVYTPLVFMSGHGDIAMAVKAIQKGAFSFLEKPFNDSELLDVVAEASEQAERASATAHATADAQRSLDSLTARERDVMYGVCAGHANKVVARQLGLSPRTVEIHRARVFHKFNVDNAQQLVRQLMAANLLDQ